MTQTMPGLHHVTAIAGGPQANVDFYLGPMRQTLVKKTVNFDAPDTYHLYYGDAAGTPGTILTFFPFANAAPGRVGPGTASAVAYHLPKGGCAAWTEALAEAGVEFDGPHERFDERLVALRDPDGLRIELIEAPDAPGASGAARTLDRGFHSVTLMLADPEPTARLLVDLFGYAATGDAAEDGGRRLRLTTDGGGTRSHIDLLQSPKSGTARQGAGSVHHVAFRAETPEIQRGWQDGLRHAGHQVTPVIDRQYFQAIYFREPGGVLFEIATDPPGFDVDEPRDALGRALMLPAQHEPRRAELERILPPLRIPQ